MGGGWSIPFWNGDTKAGSGLAQSPDSYVLVPPLISYDRSEPDRYSQSSFDWLYQKREIAMLLADGVTPGVKFNAKLIPTDEHLSTTAVLAFPNVTWRGLWDRSAGGSPAAWAPAAAVRIRAQMDELNPHTFASLYYNQLKEQPGPWLSLCRAQPGPGVGGYLHCPLQDHAKTAIIGIRYGSQDISVGIEGDAIDKSFDAIWLVKRLPLQSGSKRLLFGVQASPTPIVQSLHAAINPPASASSNGYNDITLENLAAKSNLRMFCEYQAGTPDSSLSVSVGVEGASILQMSVFQHLARVRRIYNLLEDDDVVAITNYLDLGLRMRAPLDSGKENVSFEAGAAWQVNSNLMVKALANMQRIAAAVVLKSWWNPRFEASLMGGWEFSSQTPCIGATLSMDNDGALQYERGRHTMHTGSLVRQKHIASQSEKMVAKGDKMHVPGGEQENAAQDARLLVPPTPTLKQSSKVL